MNTITANSRRSGELTDVGPTLSVDSRSAGAEPDGPGRSIRAGVPVEFVAAARDGDLYTLATACENRISIRVPERGPVLIWNWARLASTSALVSDRLTAELSAA
jgi:hypothetical protein